MGIRKMPTKNNMRIWNRVLLCNLFFCFLSTTAQAADFDELIIFGDSLSDSGQFVDATTGSLVTFTNLKENTFNTPGDVWTELLADELGLAITPSQALINTVSGSVVVPQGSNYAVAGNVSTAILGSITTSAVTAASAALFNARAGYLVENPQANPNGLYVVWGGANDVLGVVGTPQGAAANIISGVTALSAAGAGLIVVNNLPDLGLTPIATIHPLGPALLTASTQAFNTELNTQLNAMAGDNIVQTDAFGLLSELLVDPGAYGFATDIDHATTCFDSNPAASGNHPLSTQPCAAEDPTRDPNTMVFFDGIHPTQTAHQLVNDYVISILRAPAQVSYLSESSVQLGDQHHSVLNRQLSSLPGRANNGSWRMFALASYGELDNKVTALQGGGEGEAYGATFGAVYQSTENWRAGIAFATNQGELEFAQNTGESDLDHYYFSGFADSSFNNFHARLALSYVLLNFDTRRQINLNTGSRLENGKTDGDQFIASGSLGYDFMQSSENLNSGPRFSFTYQDVDVDGFSETGTSATAMRFLKHNRDSFVVEGGYDIDYAFESGGGTYTEITGAFTVGLELEDDPSMVSAALTSINANTFSLAGLTPDEVTFGVDMGIRHYFSQNIAINVGGQVRYANDDNKTTVYGINAGLEWSFD
jgi:outer membrane lipase/esterase